MSGGCKALCAQDIEIGFDHFLARGGYDGRERNSRERRLRAQSGCGVRSRRQWHAGAFRIYKDPAEMLVHIEDLGISR